MAEMIAVSRVVETQNQIDLKKRRREEAVARKKEYEELKERKNERKAELAKLGGKFVREGEKVPTKDVKNKRVKASLKKDSRDRKEAVEALARAELLLTEEPGFMEEENEMERTFKVTQSQMRKMVDLNTQAKMLDLKLPEHAPYRISWTKNGRHLAIAGRKGHVSLIDALRVRPRSEVHLNESVRDVTFLHNESLHAVAQKKYVYIYDDSGAEVHRLSAHIQPERLEFLPYHFLLASVGHAGYLRYQDTSTGSIVAELRTRLGPCNVMAQNPSNAVICLGHGGGTVTMWAPTVTKPLVKMFCHNASISSMCVSRSGRELVTAGRDGRVSIWDLRNYKKLHSYQTPRPAQTMDASQTGLLAIGCGYQTLIWKDAFRTKQQSPYMRHALPGEEVMHLKFRPYEDILGVGHTSGVQCIVVPGAGFANFDAFEANPFETKKQRRETEVHSLLEKLQPEMIALDPNLVGTVNKTSSEVLKKEAEEEKKLNEKPKRLKNKTKGRSGTANKLRNKNQNVITAEREKLRQRLAKEDAARENKADGEAEKLEDMPTIYSRFSKSKAANRADL